MTFPAAKTVVMTLAVTLVFSGCRKKKEPSVTPQAQAPTVTAPQKPATTTQKETPPSQPAASAPAAGAPSTATTTPKPKPKRAPKPPKQEPGAAATNGGQTAAPKSSSEAPTTTASTTTPPAPPKIVVQEGGDAPTGQISDAGNNHTESRQSIEQLLQSTDTNLRSLTRALNDEERSMVEQIRNYMAQARVASTDGDFTRANNLALKAHLLSDELVKR